MTPPRKILVAEDNPMNYIIIKRLLESVVDAQVVHASNGNEAVESCKMNPDFDLAFMDIQMPVMDGYEATRQIKKISPNLPVIAQTAFSETETREKAMEAGCDSYITKPIQKDVLEYELKKYLD